MKTSELTGAALDWAVHTALGLSEEGFVEVDNLYGPQWRGPEYSTSWQEGGPIIEREAIQLTPYEPASTQPKNPEYWAAAIWMQDEMVDAYGPTPLIAAMRCFVASRLGESVDIPEELQ